MANTVYIGAGKSDLSYRFYDKDKEISMKYNKPYDEIGSWKRTEMQLRDDKAHAFAMLFKDNPYDLGKMAFDLLVGNLRFVNDRVYRKYYDVILLLLMTGLRASEMCGLTIHDLDFENRFINVDHQLMRNKEIGYYIETQKTKSGIRKIPMSEEAYQALQRMLAKRKKAQPIVIDGYSDFLFLNKEGYPIIGAYYAVTFTNLVKKYNKSHEDKLPKITPHILRHTFCTRLANKNMNPKSLQYIMGHSNINITMKLYAHASIDGVKSEMISLIA